MNKEKQEWQKELVERIGKMKKEHTNECAYNVYGSVKPYNGDCDCGADEYNQAIEDIQQCLKSARENN